MAKEKETENYPHNTEEGEDEDASEGSVSAEDEVEEGDEGKEEYDGADSEVGASYPGAM